MAANILSAVLEKIKQNADNLTDKQLEVFSDIDSQGLKTFLVSWKDVPAENKVKFIQQLRINYEQSTLVSYENLGIALLDDESPSVRENALTLIAETSRTQISEKIIQMARKDESEAVREGAVKLLGSFVYLYELEEAPGFNVLNTENALLISHKEDQPRVARAALESLGYSSRPEVPDLIEQAFEKKDNSWLTSALIAASRSNDNRWAGNILNCINDPDTVVRLAAIVAAGEMGLKLARQPLLNMLEEMDEEMEQDVYEAIIWSLSSIGGEDVRTYLETILAECEDDEQAVFLDEAMTNLSFTEDMENFDMLSVDTNDDELEDQ